MQDSPHTCIWCEPINDTLMYDRAIMIDAIRNVYYAHEADCEYPSVCMQCKFYEQTMLTIAQSTRDRNILP